MKMNMVDAEVLDDLNQPVPGVVLTLHNNMIIALRKAYPTWANHWLIRVDQRGGIVQVYNVLFSGDMGIVFHIKKIDSDMRRVVREVGEFFERYGIARTKGLDIRQALADLTRNSLGEVIYED